MTQIKKVKTSEGVQFYPQTHTKAVIDDNGNVLDSTLANLQSLYNGLTQSDIVIVDANSWPLATLEENTIYRVAGSSSYSDYIYNGTTTVLMATYNNAIDSTPTANSENLVKSGGVYDATCIEIDHTSEVGEWGIRSDQSSMGTIVEDENDPHLITFTETSTMNGGQLSLNCSGLTNGKTYILRMTYTCNKTGTALSKYVHRANAQSGRVSYGKGAITAGTNKSYSCDFVYDSSHPFVGWAAADLGAGCTLQITALSVIEAVDIHDLYEYTTENIDRISGKLTYIEEQDTSGFNGAEQEHDAVYIENVDGEWVITKPGSTGYRQAGLLITSLASDVVYTWEIEYSTTSVVNNAARFVTNISAQTGEKVDVCTFAASASHAIVKFTRARGNYTYFAVTSTNMSNNSTLTLHSIRVYREMGISDIGAAMSSVTENAGQNYANVISLYNDRKDLAMNVMGASNNFSCLLFSDIHGDSVALSRIIKLYTAWKDMLDCVINVGDTNKENTTENNSWYWGNIDSLSDKQVLLALGNHDAWRSNAYDNVCDKEEYDAWILPLASRIDGLVKPTDADTLLLPYYYKDFGNIRIVVLSTYTNQTATDLAWFEDVLADAITNSKKVIAVNHISFNSIKQLSTYSEFFDSEYNKSNGFRTYGVTKETVSQQGYIPASFMTAVKTFIDNGGTFITWICGHHHKDFITDLRETSYYTTYGAIPIWNLSTARSGYQQDNPKTWSDGTGMDCFYMMSVIEGLGIFNVLKFGSTTDYSMRPRLYFSYDYVGKKLITVG